MSEPPTSGVSILLPAYNLETSIASSIDRVVAATVALDDVEIIVCDDGSEDDTRRAAETAAAGHGNVVVVGHRPNQGKGAALQTAFAASTKPTVVFLDADMDLPPEQVPGFVAAMHDRSVDALVGTKQEAMEPGRYPGYRRLLSKVFSGVIMLLFNLPVEETQTGLKAFRR
ncbi:MAG: glycosyltransferase family 2 protein, partial [Acidimicrobiia bacterium]|nr:glycosyltransferase family 2 protein [Acidimicrobiia bacterium]